MKGLIICTLYLLISSQVLSQECFDSKLIVACDTSQNQYHENTIYIYFKKNKSYQRVLEVVNQLEYFKYRGHILTDDGNQYYLFSSYSLPVGNTSLFYFNSESFATYKVKNIQEYQQPMFFTFRAEEKRLDVLSYDSNDCGSILRKQVSDLTGYLNKGEAIKNIPENQKVICEIPE